MTTPGTRGCAAVFLDRDGTTIYDRHYLSSVEDLEFLPGAAATIRTFRALGFKVIVATNQSGVARGLITESQVREVHGHMQGLLQGWSTAIDAFYYCPHHPTIGWPPYRLECSCRKPKPGLLLAAAQDLGVDLKRSFLIGDELADIAAGQAAGCGTVLVPTNLKAISPRRDPSVVPDYEAPNFEEALAWIVRVSR